MPIDRMARVRRHTIVQHGFDTASPLQVGNGNLAMTLDATGFQTFEELYHNDFALSTLSHAVWHTMPGEPTPRQAFAEHPRDEINAGGRVLRFLHRNDETSGRTGSVLRFGVHRLNLWTLGLFRDALKCEDFSAMEQHLDLWTGLLRSRFTLDGAQVSVETAAGSDDEIAFRIHGLPPDVALRLRFSYAVPEFGSNGTDFGAPEKHRTMLRRTASGIEFLREIDATRYRVACRCDGGRDSFVERAPHVFDWVPGSEVCTLTLRLGDGEAHAAEEVFAASTAIWEKFWLSGGCCDFAGSTAPEAMELERRVVLSEYLVKINCSGVFPPAETGLACNSWFGRFHLEMHFFHAVQFLLWDRPELMARSMGFYRRELDFARRYAAEQGYRGARFPKSSTPEGLPSAGQIEIYLLWHMPHLLYYAELFHRFDPVRALAEYADIVDAAAEFIADNFTYDPEDGRYHLGPPMIDAAELYRDPMQNRDPNFESAYFVWALGLAAKWRARRDLAADPHWERIRQNPPEPAVCDGIYTAGKSATDTFTGGHNYSHPMMLAPFALFQAEHFDPAIEAATVRAVLDRWDWDRESWGWDYPLTSLACARTGNYPDAVNILLKDAMGNRYPANGHNRQGIPMLPCYLPGNGSLLTAVAHLASLDGFAKLPGWRCRCEKLSGLL